MNDSQLLDTLKDILLEEDRTLSAHLRTDLDELKQIIETDDLMRERVRIFLLENDERLQQNFSKLFGEQVTQSIKTQIRESQDEVIEALYPIIGKLVKRYIQSELNRLSERVDERVNETFSPAFWYKRVKEKLSGVSDSESMATKLTKARIEEVFIIQKDSGLLMGSYSLNETMDRDMIAGMLTAIKAFVEDAFNAKNEGLQTIEYESNKIFIQEFQTYFMAVVISGNINYEFKSKLIEMIDEFASHYMKKTKEVTDKTNQENSLNLENYFKNKSHAN